MTVSSPDRDRHAAYLATRHFGSLDGLRFFCITLVIWHHVPIWEGLEPLIFSRGHTGVDFFFVLSGFLITTLLLREETRTGRFSLRGFYWRRILRIVPIYFFVVSIAALYEIGLKGDTRNLDILPCYYLFLSNFIEGRDIGFLAPTWSLAVEEQYYLIWPALLLFLPRPWIVPALLGLIGWNMAIQLGLFDRAGITAIEIGPLSFGVRGPTYAPILMGSLVAILLNTRAGFAAFDRIAGFRAAPWMWILLLGLAYALLPPTLRGWPNLVVHGLMCLVLVSLVVREDNGMARVMHFAPLMRIGQISYGIYLYHLFALAAVTKGFEVMGWTGWGWVLILYYALAIVIAEISFRTLERYFMRFRRKGWGRVQAA